jgi:carnitine O-acetyltransferase
MHAMFTDPIFAESQTWRLSTSNLHAGIRLRGTGFGTVLHFGYGINYMAAPTLVKFSIETKKVPETVTTAEFIKVLTGVLRDMKTVCKQMNHPKL